LPAGSRRYIFSHDRRERGGSQEASSPVCGEIFLVAALLRRVHLWFHFVTVFALVNADVADLLGRELHAALVDVAAAARAAPLSHSVRVDLDPDDLQAGLLEPPGHG